MVNVIKPLFDRLRDEKFLTWWERCAIQNTNESLQHVIWGLCPKEQYTSHTECTLAGNLVVLLFNSGMEVVYSEIVPNIGVTLTPGMISAWKRIDHKRVYGGE